MLRRHESDGVTLEDIDTLQLELEAMLSTSVMRKGALKEDLKVLTNIDKYKGGAGGGAQGKLQSGRKVRPKMRILS